MGRKAVHMKHKAARARSRLNELTFDMFNDCKAVNGVETNTKMPRGQVPS